MLSQHRMSEDGLHEYAKLNDICPEVLEVAFYGGKDSAGRLAQPPIGTLQDIAVATNQDWFHFMNLYAQHPNSNHMFFDKQDITELRMIYRISLDRRRAAGTWPKTFEYKVHKAGNHLPAKKNGLVNRVKARIWLDENYLQDRSLAVFQVFGDSMEGGRRPIFDGDLVVVDRDDKGHDGVPVVAQLKGGSYVCKLFKTDGQSKSLISTNPTPTDNVPFYIPIEEVEAIEGRVVEVRRAEDLET